MKKIISIILVCCMLIPLFTLMVSAEVSLPVELRKKYTQKLEKKLLTLDNRFMYIMSYIQGEAVKRTGTRD